MFKKIIGLIVLIVIIGSLFAGCGSKMSADYAVQETTAVSKNEQSGGVRVTFGESVSGEKQYADTMPSDADNGSVSVLSQYERKLIKNGTIAVEVKNVDDTYEKMIAIAKEMGGYEFSSNLTDSDTFKRIEVTIKLPPEKIDAFKAELKTLVGEGKIKSSSVYSDDITSQYYDSKARLDSLIISRDRLVAILKDAKETKDILEVEREIAIRNADIDSLQGMLNMWDKLVSMATMTVYIDQMNDPLKHTKTVGFKFNTIGEVWNTIKNGFTSVVNILYSVIIWIVIVLLAASPLIIIAGIILIILKKRSKKKKVAIEKKEIDQVK